MDYIYHYLSHDFFPILRDNYGSRIEREWESEVRNEHKASVSSGHSKAVAQKLLTVVKECTGPVQAQARPNPIMKRGVEHC